MGSLDVWGALAAAVLLIQCIFFNLILLAISVGLWYGAGWVRGKTENPGMRLANKYFREGQKLALRGQALLVAPFIKARGLGTQASTTWKRLRG